jgi:hypothetical protein
MLGYAVFTLSCGSCAGVALPYEAPEAPGGTGVVLPEPTVRLCDPVLPLLVAVIDADPDATAVTNPDVDTVATAVLELDQVMLAPEMGAPLPSRATALAWVVCPTWRLDAASVTTTDATVGEGGGATVPELAELSQYWLALP